MRYRVIIAPNAQQEIRETFAFISRGAPLSAARWIRGIHERIDTLEIMPERCELAREAGFVEGVVVRQIIFKSHRIIFFIDEPSTSVHVVAVRHAARRAMGEPADDPDES